MSLSHEHKQIQWHAFLVKELHRKWYPHDHQVKAIQAIFRHQLKLIFLECGRKFGKTELLCYFLWRWALFNPGTSCYYFAPFQKQAKEILWADRRIQSFGPKAFIDGKPNESEMRIKLKNGSFIKLDGSDNFEAYRGITPTGICVYDEFKDFRPEFHVAFSPNLAAKSVPLVIAGTPPEAENQYTQLADQIKANNPNAHFRLPTWYNPHIDREFLANEKKSLYARGEGHIWEREYGARRIKGGPNAVIPMFDEKHIYPHDGLMTKIERDKHKLQWFVTADPGTSTCFAVLFSAMNPLTKEVYHLDELYLTDQSTTSTSRVVPDIREKRLDLYENHIDIGVQWTQTYDEAAAWFSTEAMFSFQEYFAPTQKNLLGRRNNEEIPGISLIKDQLLEKKVYISDRCEKLKWEIENYVRDKNGKIPKKNDHLLDCWRYFNQAAGLDLVVESVAEKPQYLKDKEPRFYTIEDDLANEPEALLVPYDDMYL